MTPHPHSLRRRLSLCVLSGLTLGMPISSLTLAQVQSAQPPSPAMVQAYPPVHAPNAQTMLMKVAARHKEAQLVGLHLVPPDRTENVIIACTDGPRIGKPSSKGDLDVMETLKPVIRRKDKDGVYDIQMPLNDAHGKLIGMMVELIPFQAVADQEAAMAAAESLRHELESKISGRQWLFEDTK